MEESEKGPESAEEKIEEPAAAGAGGPSEQNLSEEEIRARIEDQVRRLRVEDLMLESVASILNLTARRIAKEDERDLEQAKVGIEAVRAWVELLPEEAAKQVKAALSELQMLYAKQAGGGETEGGEPEAPGGEKPPSGLWTPHERS